MKTSQKRRKTGRRKLQGAKDGVPFTSTRQPSPEAKKKGWEKKRRGQELVKAILDLSFKGLKDARIKKAASDYYGIEEDAITVEMIMIFRQVQKSIQKSDTSAFIAIMDRGFGKPKQESVVKVNDLSNLPVVIE